MLDFPHSRLPVIVIGRSTTAVSIQRLVAKLGYPLHAACPRDSWAASTKHYRPLPATFLGRWRGELGKFGYAHLHALPFEQAVLIPSSDDDALWVSRLPAKLRERFLVCCAAPATMHSLQDKGEFAELASRHGIACPASYPVSSRRELLEFPFEAAGACFFKPLDSQAFHQKFGVKALSFAGRDEALRLWDEHDLVSAGVLIQEYVPGDAADHYFIDGFIDRRGEVLAQLARRRIRMYPTDFGNSSLCESVAMSAVAPAWDALRSLLDAVAYRGIFSAEFKRDERDGRFRLIEINTRPWIYIQFADKCGINFCDLYIRDALGEELAPVDAPHVHKYCVNLVADLRALRSAPASSSPGSVRVLAVWLRAFKLLFDWSDLRPATRRLFETLCSWSRYCRRWLKQARRRSKAVRGLSDIGDKPEVSQ